MNFRNFKECEFDINSCIHSYFKGESFKDISIDINEIIESGSFILFIDALDEIGNLELREEALLQLAIFKEERADVKIICTSRPADFLLDASKNLEFKYLDIGALDRRQIETFVENYFYNNKSKSEKLIKSLTDSGILKKLPKTPLTLSLITILFDENEVEIPATITDLYGMFTDLLIGKSQIVDTSEIIEVSIKHRLLSVIALYLQEKHSIDAPRKEIENLLNKFKVERGHKNDIKTVLNDLISNTSLLIKDGDNILFKHKSFQEYFSAHEIYKYKEAKRQLLIRHFAELWWQNVTIFYGGFS